MSPDFEQKSCQSYSNAKKFGICDKAAPNKDPAYIDEVNGKNWIAVVENYYNRLICFTALDHCIDFIDEKKKMQKVCDGMLTYGKTVIFIELKERSSKKNNDWIMEAETQLNLSIRNFKRFHR